MNLSFVILIFFISASLSVDALWSRKCKEAETSDDKVYRFIQNANCTLQDKKTRLHDGLRSIHDKLNSKFQGLGSFFRKNEAVEVSTTTDGLDYAIDVRMLKDTDEDNLIDNEEESNTITPRTKRDEENEYEESTSEIDTEVITDETMAEFESPNVGFCAVYQVNPYQHILRK